MAPLTDATKIIILSVIISITALVTLVITIVIAAHLEDHPKIQNNSKKGKIQCLVIHSRGSNSYHFQKVLDQK